MEKGRSEGHRVLVAIPAYNEGATVDAVISRLRATASEFDVLVVNDGSTDRTGEVSAQAGVPVATHFCNLGYGRSLQTAIRYARRLEYDAIITFDADGQHRAEDVAQLFDAFTSGRYDLVIGSRFVASREYGSAPLARRLGMRSFSVLIKLLTGQRVYDPTSGLKVIGRRVFDILVARPSVDFHAETIIYLLKSGFSVGEVPIVVNERRHGQSMYNPMNALAYPLKVLFLIVVSAIDARFGFKGRGD